MKTFLYSDPHFGHQGICRFMSKDGVTKLRPWNTTEDMDSELIRLYNSEVGPKDKVYFLGDVAMNTRCIQTVSKLNGRKILIKGNHDEAPLSSYVNLFDDIKSCHVLDGFLLSHIPVHESCLSRWKANIHGHLHDQIVMLPNGSPDLRYVCVSVEHTDWKPILFDHIRNRFA